MQLPYKGLGLGAGAGAWPSSPIEFGVKNRDSRLALSLPGAAVAGGEGGDERGGGLHLCQRLGAQPQDDQHL